MNNFLLKLSGYHTVLEKYETAVSELTNENEELKNALDKLDAVNKTINARYADLLTQAKGFEKSLDTTLDENMQLKRTLDAKEKELASCNEIVAKFKKIREEHNRARREKRAKAREAKNQKNG